MCFVVTFKYVHTSQCNVNVCCYNKFIIREATSADKAGKVLTSVTRNIQHPFYDCVTLKH